MSYLYHDPIAAFKGAFDIDEHYTLYAALSKAELIYKQLVLKYDNLVIDFNTRNDAFNKLFAENLVIKQENQQLQDDRAKQSEIIEKVIDENRKLRYELANTKGDEITDKNAEIRYLRAQLKRQEEEYNKITCALKEKVANKESEIGSLHRALTKSEWLQQQLLNKQVIVKVGSTETNEKIIEFEQKITKLTDDNIKYTHECGEQAAIIVLLEMELQEVKKKLKEQIFSFKVLLDKYI